MEIITVLILFFPLAGFLVNSFAGKRLKGNLSGIIASTSVLISFVLVFVLFIRMLTGTGSSETISFGNWINAGNLLVPFEFRIDPLSVTMMLIITGVGFLIHVYSIGYMKGDERISVFFANMNLFTFAMLLLVSAANYLLLFAGWEGVGLCSYLLIGFWFKNDDNNYAARKAFVMNRIGDLGFLLGLILLFVQFGSFSYDVISAKAVYILPGNMLITLISLLLLAGAIGKSAQIPLYTWLPDAMAGPTPVSALIHAATMVTAGIYMIARSDFLFILSPLALIVVLIIGTFTAIFAASIGLFQNDIKKILAYSTVSQLGFMFMALGLGAFSTSVFHLTVHAFFKALLFLGAGSVIHSLHGEQDIRKMGGLKKMMPVTFLVFLAATLAISGIPPFSGFFSKDEILTRAFHQNPAIWVAAVGGALITCFYMFRLLYLTFYGNFRGKEHVRSEIHESPWIMLVPLIFLALFSVAGGLINIPELFGGNVLFSKFLQPVFINKQTIDNHLDKYSEILIMSISLIALVLIIYLAYREYVQKQRIPVNDINTLPFFKRIIARKYYIDELYELLFEIPFRWLSEKLFAIAELKVIDNAVESIGRISLLSGRYINRIQNGNIRLYLFAMVAGIIIIFFINLIAF